MHRLQIPELRLVHQLNNRIVKVKDGLTVLCHAVFTGNLNLVEFLLQNGADPNFVTKDQVRSQAEKTSYHHLAVFSSNVCGDVRQRHTF